MTIDSRTEVAQLTEAGVESAEPGLAVYTVAIELAGDVSTFLRAVNAFLVAQLTCVRVSYEPRGCAWLSVIEVETSRADRLETVVKRIANLVGVHACCVVGIARPAE